MTAKKTVFLNLFLAAAFLIIVPAVPAHAKMLPCELCDCSSSCSGECEDPVEGVITCGESESGLCECAPCDESCSCVRSCSYGCDDEGDPSTCSDSGNLCIYSPECSPPSCRCGINIYGTSGNDTLTGNAYNNCIYGYAGDDSLYGSGGHDKLYGGSGNDSLYGGDGNDCLYGGSGFDYLDGGPGTDYCTEGETYVSCEQID